ncbi:mechanosensitive ion channel family protein [Mucilaginibacter daejeonensis]|uniref:mechanosensitive ion channel family protein n=1 Tax=Mucilaginibacter daejeonensis TaxID=398049 RepID=UPI001D178DCC|nr:mechanosensitive ion channel domain-containing protein [Mucilaginibacter daejeonensis]UEG55136.1 mechanosensitive ion channel family protein [Mucilaginibacter daejeonensis]
MMQIQAKLPPDLLDYSQHMPSFIWNLCIAITALIIGLILKFVTSRLLRIYANKQNDYSFFRSFITHLSTPVTYFIPLVVLKAMMPLMRMYKTYYALLDRVTSILLIIVFAILLIRAIRVLEDYVYHFYDLNKSDNLKERKIRTQLKFLRKLLVAIIVFVTIALVLLSFESFRKLGAGLLTGVGIGGIIIGFAAQNSLGNLLAGMQLAFTQPIRIDDVLVVEGEWGRVEDITLTYVVLRIWDQRRLILPINYFITKPFQNWTRISADIIGSVFLYMDYTIPLAPLRAEFDRLMLNTKLCDGKVKALQVTDAKERTMEIRMLVSARNSSDAFDLRCYVRENMITFIQQNYPGSLPKIRTDINDKFPQAIPESAITPL